MRNLLRRNIVTVTLEDFFHSVALAGFIEHSKWSRFDLRLEQNTLRALDLLDRHNAKATFFVLGWVAERRPDVVREVVRRGHEVASSGYAKRSFRQITPVEFREDLRRSRDLIECASGRRVVGFRVADRLLTREDLWALEVLAEEGYLYDSSLSPSLRSFHDEPWRRFPHRQQFGDRAIWEFPLPTINLCGLSMSIAGGNYLRQLPEFLIRPALAHWHRAYDSPFILYFRIWDLDPDQPIISGAPLFARLRHYRHPDKMPRLLDHILSQQPHIGVSEYLGQPAASDTTPDAGAARSSAGHLELHHAETTRIEATIVIPCFNEELVLPYLANTLRELQTDLGYRYDFHYILVDDGSSDGTWSGLQSLRAALPNCTTLRHVRNQGVLDAIMTGLRNARTDVVCSIDSDCSYDPRELGHMIPMLVEGVDLVTASPYHPDGKVLNVARWRLALSKVASLFYRYVLGASVHTYTSCFRVYRREVAVALELTETGFLGVAEMMSVLVLRGSRVAEHPATLEVRVLGHSKMKVVRTIGGHLRLLSKLTMYRFQEAARERWSKPPAVQHRRGVASTERKLIASHRKSISETGKQ